MCGRYNEKWRAWKEKVQKRPGKNKDLPKRFILYCSPYFLYTQFGCETIYYRSDYPYELLNLQIIVIISNVNIIQNIVETSVSWLLFVASSSCSTVWYGVEDEICSVSIIVNTSGFTNVTSEIFMLFATLAWINSSGTKTAHSPEKPWAKLFQLRRFRILYKIFSQLWLWSPSILKKYFIDAFFRITNYFSTHGPILALIIR